MAKTWLSVEEQAVATSSFATMRWIEILLRTAFTHHYAQHVAPPGALQGVGKVGGWLSDL
mgnify:CR=1 FL=1